MSINEGLFLLDSEELKWALSKNTPTNKLIAATMLKFFQLENHYPDKDNPPYPELISSLIQQLGIPDIDTKITLWEPRKTERFRYEIRQLLKYREATKADGEALVAFLIKKSHDLFTIDHYRAIAYQFFKEHQTEPLSSERVDRHIRSAMHRFEKEIFGSIDAGLSKEARAAMDLLFDKAEDDPMQENEENTSGKTEKEKPERIKLWDLKKDLRGVKLKHIQFELKKLACLREIKLPMGTLKGLHRKTLEKYYARILAAFPGNIREFVAETRYPMMAIFCYVRTQRITDYLVDLLIKLIDKIKTSAEKSVDRKILLDVRRVDGKFDILGVLAEISATSPLGVIEKEIYPKVSQETLKDLSNELKHRGKWYQNEVHIKMRSLYSHGQRAELLSLLKAFEFKDTHTDESRALVAALGFILKHLDLKDIFYPKELKAPLQVLPNDWKVLVCEGTGEAEQINRINYEIGILEALSKQLGYKGIWAEGGHRYRDPQEDLPQDWETRREYYYKLLNLPLNSDDYITGLQQKLDEGLKSLNENMLENKKVKILDRLGGRIKLSPSEPQALPSNLHLLQREISQRWSNINMLDILKEADLLLGFTEQFQSVASKESLDRQEHRKRILLCLYGLGSNIGLKRVCSANRDVTDAELRYTQRRFINIANVKAATVAVVNEILRIRDPKWWGQGTTGCACDSTKIAVWDENLMSEYHVRYKGHGVMIYLHVDKKSMIIHSRLKTCSSSEVAAMIQGFLQHDTQMEMNKLYMDTHGQSVLGFALGSLLWLDLLPRLKNLSQQKLFYSSRGKKDLYPNLTPILKEAIKWKHPRAHYDEVVKHIVALKLGMVEPDVLIKKFSRDNYNNPVFKALMEIGKAEKTIFLCKYLASEELRIEIQESLNIVEMVNSTIGFIFYGKLGEISTNHKDDQELAIACLHLLQVCMIYINTMITQSVLSDPKWEKLLASEDKRALTPSFHGHINPYGLFLLDFETRIDFETYQTREESLI
jgi:TnpA family transposase